MAASGPFDIAALLPGIGVFGGIRRFIALGNELIARGHAFTIYHPGGEPPDWLPFAGVTRPLDALPSHRHDVLICNNPPQLDAFDRADARMKLFYFAMHDVPGERAIVRRRDWVIAVNSTSLHRRLRVRYRVNAERAIGGVDASVFSPAATFPPANTEFRVLVFARASRPRKGVQLAIRSVERFAAGVQQPVRLVLFDHVGSGNERDPRELVTPSIASEFHINPDQSGLASLYRGANAFVSAERRAGWSNTVAEAMACGAPVVCSRAGTGDIALPGETARVVPVRASWLFVRALRRLHDDSAATLSVRSRALERIQRYTWPRVADQMEDIIARRLA